jgi:type II secretory pathway pseudopilin PulG
MDFALAVYYMNRTGQARNRADGYAMAALLVAIAVMAVAMTVALPVWRQAVQREKEEELVFRGQQYIRALQLYQRKYAAAYPPDIDLLVKQKFLRQKYRDPMVADGEFEVLYQGSQLRLNPGQFLSAGPEGQRQGPGQAGSAPALTFDSRSGAITQGTPVTGVAGPRGGVIGVRSKSTAESIRVYDGATHYNEWQFVLLPSAGGRGGPGGGMGPGLGTGSGPGRGGGRGGPGGRGGQGPFRGGPGFEP